MYIVFIETMCRSKDPKGQGQLNIYKHSYTLLSGQWFGSVRLWLVGRLALTQMPRWVQTAPWPVKSLIRNGVISGMGCQVRVKCLRRVWCAVVGEGVGGNGKYYRCRMSEWSSSRFFVNMDMSTEAIKWHNNWPNGKQKSQNKNTIRGC